MPIKEISINSKDVAEEFFLTTKKFNVRFTKDDIKRLLLKTLHSKVSDEKPDKKIKKIDCEFNSIAKKHFDDLVDSVWEYYFDSLVKLVENKD